MPRQGGVVPKLYGRITLLPKYRVPEAIYGLDGFSHIWLLWDFSESHSDDESGCWSPTVRPPRLGGNKRMGVFATRSPFRPNSIGLSVVKLEKIDFPDIYVSGVDLMDGTPIYDIKPYIPYSDSVPEAKAGFTDLLSELKLKVCFPENLMNELLCGISNLSQSTTEQSTTKLSADEQNTRGQAIEKQGAGEQIKSEILDILSHDMRPQYQNDPERVYGITYLHRNIRFKIDGDTLTVLSVE